MLKLVLLPHCMRALDNDSLVVVLDQAARLLGTREHILDVTCKPVQ